MTDEERENAYERLRKIKELKIHRMRTEKYRYYDPNGVGEQFIDAIASGDYFICFLSAANGVGKTALMANILAHLMFPMKDNPYFQGKLFTDWPFLKKGRIITDSALIDKNLIPELKFWFPEGQYETRKASKHYETLWKTKTGWEFDMMTYEQEAKEFEGVTLGWAWFDEPPPDAILQATIARMRRGGIIFITATPISGSAHLYDTLAKGEMEVEVQMRENEDPIKVKRRIFHMTADVESACKTHGIRGHLQHEDIAQMIAEYPEDERQARVYGKFQHLIGLIFKRFSRQIHVIDPFRITPEDFVVMQFLDPHPRNPDAALWLATDKNGTKYVCDELYYKPKDIPDLAFRLKKKDSDYRIIHHGIDPSAAVEDQHRPDTAWKTQLEKEGITYIPASKTRVAADKRIETALNYNETNGYMVKAPELYIFSTCERTIFELEHYRWQEWTGKAADLHDRKEERVDKDDHMIENLGRALLMEASWTPLPLQQKFMQGMSNADFDPYA